MSNADFIKGLYDAFARGDIETVLGAMAPRIEWNEAESSPYHREAGPFIGPDEVLSDVLMKLGADWEGFVVRPHAIHDAGNVVVAECRYGGTHRATGNELNAQACHVWTVEDGKVVRFQQYTDTAHHRDVMAG